MPYVGTGSTGSTVEGRREDLNDILKMVANHFTPILSEVLDPSAEATNYKHEWVDKPLAGYKDSILAAATLVTLGAVISVAGGTNTPKKYIDGITIIRVNNEQMLVTSTVTVVTNSRVIAVTRAQRGTTAVQHAPLSQIFIMNPRVESFEADRNDAQFGTRKYNLTRIFESQYGLSGTVQALTAPGEETKLKHQRLIAMNSLLKEVQIAMFHGARYESGATRDMGGLIWWAQQGGGNSSDAGGASVTTGFLDDIIENYANSGGNVEKMQLFCSFKQQRKINALKAARLVGAHMQSDKNLNNIIETYEFNGKARIKLMATTDLMDHEMIVVEEGKVRVIPLAGRALQKEDLAKTGDATKEMIVGEYTLEARNVKETLFHYSNLAVS